MSALDVSVQAQVLNLLEDLKAKHGLTLIFIAHDLAVVKNISDRIAVMYLGKLCEVAPGDDLYAAPMHPYTNVLLASIPVPDPEAAPAEVDVVGEPPSPVLPPPGADSTRAVRTSSTSARPPSRSCARWRQATSSPATTR